LNIGQFITSLNPFDVLVFFALFGMFILGFIQGTLRRLLGLGAILFAFLLAANLRQPLGDYLARNWTHLAPEYSFMIGFGVVFVAASVVLTILIQSFYDKTPLFEKYDFVDEVLGGILGIAHGVLLLAVMIVILDSFFRVAGVAERNSELPFLRGLFELYDPSATASVMRGGFIPGLFAVLGLFIPDALRPFFPGGQG
jgi:uncharacterized membrane protein required for colicin V production